MEAPKTCVLRAMNFQTFEQINFFAVNRHDGRTATFINPIIIIIISWRRPHFKCKRSRCCFFDEMACLNPTAAAAGEEIINLFQFSPFFRVWFTLHWNEIKFSPHDVVYGVGWRRRRVRSSDDRSIGVSFGGLFFPSCGDLITENEYLVQWPRATMRRGHHSNCGNLSDAKLSA